MTNAWGDPDTTEGGDKSPPSGDLGGGSYITFRPEVWRGLLHRPDVLRAITRRAQQICDAANNMVALDPRAVERLTAQDAARGVSAAYAVSVQNEPETSRARARIYPAGLLGTIDEKANSTLWKVRGNFESDPIPDSPATSEGDFETPEPAEPAEPETPEPLTGPGFGEEF